MMDAKIKEIIRKSAVGGLSRIHQKTLAQELARRFAEILAEYKDPNIYTSRTKLIEVLLSAAGIEEKP